MLGESAQEPQSGPSAEKSDKVNEAWAKEVGERIKSSSEPVASDQVRTWVEQAGGPDEYFRGPSTQLPRKSDVELARKLNRETEAIRFSKATDSFSWSEKSVTTTNEERSLTADDALKLLAEWLEADDTRKAQLGARITAELPRSPDEVRLLPIAQAVGAIAGDPDWGSVDVGDCQLPPVLEAVSNRAPTWWLIDTAVRPSAKASATTKDALRRLPEAEKSATVVGALIRWFSDQRADETSAQVRRIRSVMKAIETPVNTDVVTTALDISMRIFDDANASHDLLALLSLLSSADSEALRSGLDLLAADAPIKGYLNALADTKKSQRERIILLIAVAQSDKADSLFDAGVFSALDLDQLGEVLGVDPFPKLRAGGLDEHLVTPVRAATKKFGLTLASVASHPHLEPLIPVDLLSKYASRDEASARVGQASMAKIIADAIEEGEKSRAATVNALREVVAEHERQLETAAANAHDMNTQVLSLETRLREASTAKASAMQGELRQAQLDAIQVIIDLAVLIGDVASGADVTDPLHDITASAERSLANLGVVVVGERGEVLKFDPAVFEGPDIVEGSRIEVVRPAYVLQGGTTPLRYGLARPIP